MAAISWIRLAFLICSIFIVAGSTATKNQAVSRNLQEDADTPIVGIPAIYTLDVPHVGDSNTSSNGTSYTYMETERRQILTWMPIIMAAVLALALYALLNMKIERDPLLYTRFNTAPTHA